MHRYGSYLMFQGDSGGALTYNYKGQHVLVGVTSYAKSKCGSSSVSVKEGLNALYFILNCISNISNFSFCYYEGFCFSHYRSFMHADKSIYRRNGIYLIYLQKFPTIEIGLRARCQIHNTVRRDQTHWIGKCHALVVGCIAQKLVIIYH